MERLSHLFLNPSVQGHTLIQPVLWYGRTVKHLCTDPLPEKNKTCEVLARLVSLIALALLSCVLFILVPMALVGLATKFTAKPPASAPPPDDRPPSSSPAPPELPSAAPVPPRPAFIPASGEVVAGAQELSQRLSVLYNDLKDLSGRAAQELFEGVALFRSTYEQHRNPSQYDVDEMTKVFDIVDQIAANTSGMQKALDQWSNFYRVQSDDAQVIAQPKDGNCWLHTSILGLQLLNHQGLRNPEGAEYTYQTLRPVVVQWMRDHYAGDEELREYIARAIEAHIHVEGRRLNDDIGNLQFLLREGQLEAEQNAQAEQRLEELQQELGNLPDFGRDGYFAHMERLGSHGSQAELYAISKMFHVNVVVWRDVPAWRDVPRRLTNEYDPPFRPDGAEGTINAVLTQEGNHFNFRLPEAEAAAGAQE